MILFFTLFAVLQIAYSGLFSVAQNNIVSNCSFALSADNLWLAETCDSATNMYKFNGTAFNKLPYTIPLSGSGCQMSVNAYGNFIAKANGTTAYAYKFNETSATNVLNKTFALNYLSFAMASNGTTITHL